jgi:exodeoxyribonuclease V alpha subunit
MADTTATEVSGSVTFLNCQKPTFCAGKMRTKEGEIIKFSVKGHCKVGDNVTLCGEWEDHPKWKWQFKAKTVLMTLPTDAAGLVKWLNWNAMQIGPVKAQRMVDEFGTKLMDLCVSDPEQVAIFAKVPLESIEKVAASWVKAANFINAVTWLAGIGLTQNQCESVIQQLGASAVSAVQDNVYCLLGRVDGFGWKTVDEIAAGMGIVGEDPRRVRGALAAVVIEVAKEGSTCIESGAALVRVCDKIGTRNTTLVSSAMEEAILNGDVVKFGTAPVYLATPRGLMYETKALKHLRRSRERCPHRIGDPAEVAELYRKCDNMTLDDEQVRGIENALRYRISVITGSGGSGKTSVSKLIVQAFEDRGVHVWLCAPTGKAARRMSEVIDRQARTIHKLLEYNGGTGRFTRDELTPIEDAVVLVDEASMIDAMMMYHLMSSIGPTCSVVFVGDPNQLPPVGAGSPLRDILEHNLAPTTRLEKVHRQAGDLKVNSVKILSGAVAPNIKEPAPDKPSPWMVHTRINSPEALKKNVQSLYREHLPKWGFHPIRDVQFMTAKHEHGYGTKRINSLLQWLHQTSLGNPVPEPDFETDEVQILRVGDKVIQTKNDYDLGVMNGEIGIVAHAALTRGELRESIGIAPLPATDAFFDAAFADVSPDNAPAGYTVAMTSKAREDRPVVEYVVDFGDRKVVYPNGSAKPLELAYCLSVHKMQGSQVPCAIVICPVAHSFMQNRQWLYTAVTRAQKTCVIMGDPDGIRRAAEKVVLDERVTVTRVLALESPYVEVEEEDEFGSDTGRDGGSGSYDDGSDDPDDGINFHDGE